MAEPGTQETDVEVGGVVPPCVPAFFKPLFDDVTGGPQERPDDAAAGGGHAAQPGAAAQQLHGYRFRLVANGVGREDAICTDPAGGTGQERVAEAAGSVLEVPAFVPGNTAHVDALGMHGNTEFFSEG